MSDTLSTEGWERKQHTVSGARFILKYETFGPKGYADKISRLMHKISQGKPAQKAIFDGIFRNHLKLVIEYDNKLKKRTQAGRNHTGTAYIIEFDPTAMTEEVLFQHRDTKQFVWRRADGEEILIHELYHEWLDGHDAQLVKIGAPSQRELAIEARAPRESILAEGYTIRYLNAIREANGSRWMRLTHEAKSPYRGSHIYLFLDGPEQGQLKSK